MKVIIDEQDNKYLWERGDLHIFQGVVKEKDIKNGIIETHLGKRLIVFDASFVDKLEKIKRGPAILTKKDIGEIISYTGINSKSKVVDAGAGCGVLAAYFAGISKNVVSYEKNKEFYELAKKNIEFLNVRVKLKNKDIYEDIDEKNLDLITLDLLEPWKAVKNARKSLKCGGFLVCYLTNINQMNILFKELKGFYVERVIETIEREWIVDDIKVRPKNTGILHTGFLLFARRI